jgi:hypothetical protein
MGWSMKQSIKWLMKWSVSEGWQLESTWKPVLKTTSVSEIWNIPYWPVHTAILLWKSVDWNRTCTLKALTPPPMKVVVVTWPGAPFKNQVATIVILPDGYPLVQPIDTSQGKLGVGLALKELLLVSKRCLLEHSKIKRTSDSMSQLSPLKDLRG